MITRQQLRELVRRQIDGYPRFESFTVVRRWGQDIGEAALPAVGVFTPRVTKRREAVRAYSRETDVAVLIRRKGGIALEDDLDLDVDVLAELLVRDMNCHVEDFEMLTADFDIPGSGDQRIGSALITFRALQLTQEPG